ncbi:MAG TPA: ANTAR domain-containing protein [Nocardioidaceae bacterium]|nr:ANTAR domain-containing protein [Nocardioidaceae bacterium]
MDEQETGASELRPVLVDPSAPAVVDPSTAQLFRALADVVYVADDYSRVYEAIVRAAPHLVEGCHHASLMLRVDGRFVTVASSDSTAAQVDSIERELDEGPCLDAIKEQTVFHDADLADGSPWPRLTERVLADTPVRSMAGFRIRTGNGHDGALNLFSDRSGGLSERAVDQGIVLASFITVALVASHERRSAQTLRSGLLSNREIGKAVGLMMAFHSIDDEAAFTMLRRTSQQMNVKLVEVARQVVDDHNTRGQG